MAEQPNNVLDRILAELERLNSGGAAPGASATDRPDAIDRVLAAPPRATDVASLRDHPAVETFRRDLSDGLIRADAARQLLGLIAMVLERLPALK